MISKPRTIRVLSVDDHAFVTEGLKARLDVEPDLELTGRQSNAAGLVEAVDRAEAHIVLLDIDMPGPDSFEAMQDLHRRRPEVRTILFSAHVRDRYIDQAFDHGAWGYFSKGDEPEAVVSGIRKVARGEYAYSPLVDERLRDVAAGEAESSLLNALTKRELEILRLIGKGMSRADIGRELHRSRKTIDAHHTSIMKKLDIHDRAELVRYVISEGLVDC